MTSKAQLVGERELRERWRVRKNKRERFRVSGN